MTDDEFQNYNKNIAKQLSNIGGDIKALRDEHRAYDRTIDRVVFQLEQLVDRVGIQNGRVSTNANNIEKIERSLITLKEAQKNNKNEITWWTQLRDNFTAEILKAALIAVVAWYFTTRI